MTTHAPLQATREHLVHALYEAAELEHSLMCTYLYAAFSLRSGEAEGLSASEAPVVSRWRQDILRVAIEEMGHLTAVWNITSALGGSPRFGRGNFPLDPGILPAGVVVKLAPFSEAVLQHFVFLERPKHSSEPDGEGFASEFAYRRGVSADRLTPMAQDYDTVGAFYASLGESLVSLVERAGEQTVLCGDPALQLSPNEVELSGARPVLCLKTALQAFGAIVKQGEGAEQDAADSHYQRFARIRAEYAELKAQNPDFSPAFPAATNPLLRPPLRAEGRVFLENEQAAAVVDVANTAYAMMLRLMAYAYVVPGPSPEKQLVVDLALGLMRGMTFLAERAARMPAGPSHPGCHAGMSFTALRDAAPFPPGPAARRFFVERLLELASASEGLENLADPRVGGATRIFVALAARAADGLMKPARPSLPIAPPEPVRTSPGDEPTSVVDGVEVVEGKDLRLMFEGKRCIHARACVTRAPKVFLANVVGPWIHPDAMDTELLVGVAHDCPSGAIRYQRKDGRADEPLPPVNLLSVREAGPYALRGQLRLDGRELGIRATLCRCGASKQKPFCDGSHHDVPFTASGEPATLDAEALAQRHGPLDISPQVNGPLRVRGNLEIISGTGRVVARRTSALFCRCGASATKPFCDGSHARVGFQST